AVAVNHPPRSDHRPLTLTLQWGEAERPTLRPWKLTTAHLNHQSFRETYLQILTDENPAAAHRTVTSKRKAWDRHKLRVQRYATSYGIRLKRQADLRYSDDSRLLDRIDGDLAALPPGDDRDDL
ncbi:hypothetical protein LPJ53_006617, partial [Coemansia erecta]